MRRGRGRVRGDRGEREGRGGGGGGGGGGEDPFFPIYPMYQRHLCCPCEPSCTWSDTGTMTLLHVLVWFPVHVHVFHVVVSLS